MTAQGSAAADWRSRLEAASAEAERMAGALREHQLSWVPPGGGWSVAQVLDHLSTTNEEYLVTIGEALEDARPGGNDASGWKPSLAGGMLARALRSPRRAKAPRSFTPVADPSAHPLERFRATVGQLLTALDRAASVDLRRTRIHSPAARLIRLNLGDGFHLQVLHAERHLQQIQRLTRHAEFPT